MPVVTMTALWLTRVKAPESGRVEYFDKDTAGFGLRVSFSGVMTWFIHYRVEGDRKKRRMILGKYPHLTLGAARDKAKEALLRASRGDGPAEEKARHKACPTIKELADDYLELYSKPQKRTWTNDRWIIDNDLVPAWGGRKADAIRRKDVIALLDVIAKRGAPIQANRTLACIRKMYNWAIGRDILENNPTIQVKPVAPENQRERWLNEDEIRAVWRAIDGMTSLTLATIYKLRLLTAQRGGEICKMRWQDVDLEDGWWIIPAEHAKNKHAHRVPLSPPAVRILRQMKEKTGWCEWVFPSSRARGDEIKPSSISFLNLRRTVASHMTKMGIRLTVSKVLNHAEAGVTHIYDRYEYDTEKREAINAWAEKLEEIIGVAIS